MISTAFFVFDSPFLRGDTEGVVTGIAMTQITPEKSRNDVETAQSSSFGDFQVVEVERLDAEVKEAQKVAEENPDDDRMKKYVTIAEKKKELFLSEHDNTGSYKFKRFGRETRALFDSDPETGDAAMLSFEDGKIEIAEGYEGKRIVLINMGELDRFNKEGGGHAAGDEALHDAAVQIEKIVKDSVHGSASASDYEVFRYSGTEFMVSVDGMTDDAEFSAMMDALNSAEAGIPSNDGVEKVPLIANGTEFAEVVEMVNQLEIERTDGNQIEDEDDANREIVGVMRSLADAQMDIHKFIRRAERIQEKLVAAGDDPEQLEEVSKYFENYMGKVFKGTGLETLDDFRPESLTADALEKKATEVYQEKRGITHEKENLRDEIVQKVLDARRAATIILDTENFTAEFAAEREAGGGGIANIPEMTEGQREVQRMKDEATEIRATGDPEEAMIAELDAQIEDARRDRGTGLLERGEYYKQLEQHFEESAEQKTEKSVLFIDMGFLKYFDKKGGADVGDAALKMGAELMKNAFKGVNDAEGNLIDGTTTSGEVFRYGGDEFTVIIDGGTEEVERYKQILELLKQEEGKIPTGKQGTDEGYHPTELVFNYGSADTKLVDELMGSFIETGVYSEEDLKDPARVKNIKAELMTLVADKGIEQEKAVGRFMMLIEAKQNEEYKKTQVRKEQIDNMVTFSFKAIFSEKGGVDFLERKLVESEKYFEEGMKDLEYLKKLEAGKDPERLKEIKAEQEKKIRAEVEKMIRAEVETWVREQIKDRALEEKKHTELKDQLAEVHVRVWSAERKIRHLETALEEKTEENEHLIAQLERMRKEKEIAEKDKAEIIRLRGKVEGQRPDQEAA